MNRNPHPHGADGESLQADVMRFMAIIAFCLIAILSLVRSVDPLPVVEEETAEPVAMESIAVVPESVPAAEPIAITPMDPPPVEAPAVPAPQAPEPESAKTIALSEHSPSRPAEPVPTSIAEPAPLPPLPVPQPVAEPPPVPSEEPPLPEPRDLIALVEATTPDEVETNTATEAQEADEGLILRFVSDGDFLRLIAKGDVQVYAFRERHFLVLGQNYQFHSAPAPEQVYEVMAETIPALIDSALAQNAAAPKPVQWGISLPVKVERQIQGYLNTISSGQLLIDRYGEVHHVATR